MTQTVLVATAAGLAAALLFASVASGSLLSIPLFYLAPLPALIAAMGWTHLAGLLAVMVGALALAVVFNGVFGLAFLLGVGLPAWWLAYLALLARPVVDATGTASLEWFPVGHLLAWTSVLGALIVSAAVLSMASDAESLRVALDRAFQAFLRHAAPGSEAAGAEPSDRWLLRALGTHPELVMPATGAILATLTLNLSLWLSARTLRVSGRLRRPWPRITALALPLWLIGVLAVSLAAAFIPGLIGVLGAAFTATSLVAYGLLGLAIVHHRTRGLNGRGAVLTAVYAAVMVFGWPFLVMAMLGLADAFFPLRSRPDRGAPPALPT